MDNIEQKAKELIDKFAPYTWSGASFIGIEELEMTRDNPKECALICVDEILKVYEHVDENIIKRKEQFRPLEEYDHWQQVKEKIQSL